MSAEEQKQRICVTLEIMFFQVQALEQKWVLVLNLDFSFICLYFESWTLIPYFQSPKGKNAEKETPSLQALSYKELYAICVN